MIDVIKEYKKITIVMELISSGNLYQWFLMRRSLGLLSEREVAIMF
jgi:serine/threonine protein kinase